MIRATFLLLLAPVAAHAQLQLLLVNGAQQTALTSGSTYSLGQVGSGTPYDFVVRAQNNGTAPIAIATNNPALSGTGYSITSPPPDSQPNLAPGSFLNVYIHFAGGAPASYSASFQFNTIVVYFVITALPSATLTVASPCAGPNSVNSISFGNIAEGQTAPCTFTLQNKSSQQITVSSVGVTGTGFLLSQPPATPLNLPAGTSSTFIITFTPQSAALYSGTLIVDSQSFLLAGTAYNPPLPTPVLQFDSSTAQSSQQVTLTLTLPTPSPVAASGSVTLTFQPDASVSKIASNDPTIVFVANGARSIPFSIPANATQATFAGQPGAVFQTGTTTGKITFTATLTSGAQFSGNPVASLTLAPLPVHIEDAAATSIAGVLNIQVWGFDNTYSAGAMSFTFYDTTGAQIGAGPIMANFGSAFLTFFSTSSDGSAFQMLVSFPISGHSSQVGSVNVQLTNSAGTSTISQLAFLNDSGSCLLINNVVNCNGTVPK